MPDQPAAKHLAAVWRDQPEEKMAVDLQQFMNRRTSELYSSTRWEIITSIGAALFFSAVVLWRVASTRDHLQQLGIGLIIAWILISLYWFRDRIWRAGPPPIAAVAAPGLEYYRSELVRRRDHLRNAWLWHGPLFLACVVFVVTFAGKSFPTAARLRGVLPLVIILAAWTAVGWWRRSKQAAELQREIDELPHP